MNLLFFVMHTKKPAPTMTGGRSSSSSPQHSSDKSVNSANAMRKESDNAITKTMASNSSSEDVPTVDGPSDEPAPCQLCQEMVTDDTTGISCDNCNDWLHQPCSQLTKKDYNYILKAPTGKGFKWWCKKCRETQTSLPQPPLHSAGNQAVNLNELLSQVTMLISQVFELQKQQKSMLDMLKDERNLERKIQTQMNEILDGRQEAVERKNNLIIFNLPEQGDTNEERKAHDFGGAQEIISFLHPGAKTSEENVTRLGQIRQPTHDNPNPKPRPVKVTLCNPQLRGNILKNSRKIRDNPTLRNQKIGVSADKSKSDLEREKREYNEYQRRKALNEPVVFYAGWCREKKDLPLLYSGTHL